MKNKSVLVIHTSKSPLSLSLLDSDSQHSVIKFSSILSQSSLFGFWENERKWMKIRRETRERTNNTNKELSFLLLINEILSPF